MAVLAGVLGAGCGGRSRGADAAVAPDLAVAARPAALPQTTEVRGRVLEAGKPAAGVRVRIGTAGRTRSVETDRDGRFAFRDVAPGAYTLAADLPARALGAVMPVDVALTPEPEPDLVPDGGAPVPRAPLLELTVELAPTTPLSGTVRDEAGKSLPGAFVRVEEEERPLPVEVESGPTGRFTVEGRLKGRAYRVTVRRAGYIADGPRLVKAGGPPLEVRLRRGATLTGTVVDERGAPVAGAELAVVSDDDGGMGVPLLVPGGGDPASDGWRRLEPAGELGVLHGPIPYPPLQAPPVGPVTPHGTTPAPAASLLPRSDGKGAFRIAELAPGKVIVTARHPDYAAAATVPLQLAAGATRSVQLVLRQGTTLRGRVLDDRGAGIADAEVVSSEGRTAISDAGGRFVLPHLVASVKLVARKQGYLKAEAKVEIHEDQREVGVDLTLARALGRLGGQVLDARGNAVEGARVTVTPRGGEPARATTDAGGRFMLDGLPDGPYRVEVEHSGAPVLRLPALEASAEARLMLENGGGVEGEVLDPRLGAPPPDARLEIVLEGERRAVPLSGRYFRALGLPSGPAQLVVRARGYPRVERTIEIPAGDRPGDVTVRDVRLELELGGQVRGRVRDDRGEPLGGAEVEVAGAPTVEPARAGPDGGFSLTGVPAGRARLRARTADGRSAEEEVEVRANEESRVDLIVPASP